MPAALQGELPAGAAPGHAQSRQHSSAVARGVGRKGWHHTPGAFGWGPTARSPAAPSPAGPARRQGAAPQPRRAAAAAAGPAPAAAGPAWLPGGCSGPPGRRRQAAPKAAPTGAGHTTNVNHSNPAAQCPARPSVVTQARHPKTRPGPPAPQRITPHPAAHRRLVDGLAQWPHSGGAVQEGGSTGEAGRERGALLLRLRARLVALLKGRCAGGEW